MSDQRIGFFSEGDGNGGMKRSSSRLIMFLVFLVVAVPYVATWAWRQFSAPEFPQVFLDAATFPQAASDAWASYQQAKAIRVDTVLDGLIWVFVVGIAPYLTNDGLAKLVDLLKGRGQGVVK